MDIFSQAADSIAIEQAKVLNSIKRKKGRPSQKEVLSRKLGIGRTPITGDRSRLEVQGKDPGYSYRWIRDTDETGSEVLRFLNAGYSFVTNREDIIIGESSVYQSRTVGGIIRVSAGRDGDWLYLMKIPLEWYEEDQKSKMIKVDKTEEAISNPEIEGKYGSIKIT